jgi:hypothetical protein
MNPFEFVITIIIITGVFSIVRARMGIGGGPFERFNRFNRSSRFVSHGDNDETLRLRDEVKELKERLKVLERITVEKENSLTREIESLRDR